MRIAEAASASGFVAYIIDNLRNGPGARNHKRGERLVFARLDPYPGQNLRAREPTVCENAQRAQEGQRVVRE